MKFTILDKIWTKMSNRSPKKLSNSFTFIDNTTMLLQLGSKNGSLELLRCKWINFFHKMSECIELGPHCDVNHSGHTGS